MPLRPLSLNERRVLELVLTLPNPSRVDLAELTGLTPPSVTRLLAGLEPMGLLDEEVERNVIGARGQPKRKLAFRRDQFYAAGLAVHPDYLEVVLIRLDGEIFETEEYGLRSFDAFRNSDMAAKAVARMRARHGVTDEQFVGTGCAIVPGFQSANENSLLGSIGPDLTSSIIDDAFGRTVGIELFGNALALAEYVLGEVREYRSSMYVLHIDQYIRGGAIVDGRLLRGGMGEAGLPILAFPPGKGLPTTTGLYHATRDGHERGLEGASVREEWRRGAGEQLSFVVQLLTDFFDPDVVVFGGEFAQSNGLVEAVRDSPLVGRASEAKRALVVLSRLALRERQLPRAVGAACIPIYRSLYPGATEANGTVLARVAR